MDIADIFTLARLQSGGTSVGQISDADLLKYANFAYKKIGNYIVNKVNEKYFYDILITDTVAGQNEYLLKSASATVQGTKKVITVAIKDKGTTTYYTPIDRSTSEQSTLGIDEQKVSPDQENFYEIKDGSIFLFPAPSTSVTSGLMIESIMTLKDLTVSSTEEDIFPNNTELREYHELIAMGIVPYIFGEKKQINDKIESRNYFMQELARMAEELSDRVNADMIASLPNSSEWK